MWALIPALLLTFSFSAGLGKCDELESFPPPVYYYKAEQINLLNHEVITYEFWYDSDLRRLRVDYYDGLETRYFHEDTMKENFKRVHYTADENGNTKRTCSIVEADEEPVEPFPRFDVYKSQLLEKKSFTKTREDDGVTITLNFKNGVPFRQSIKEFSDENGDITKNVIIKYYYYETFIINSSQVLDPDLNCETISEEDEFTNLIHRHDPDIHSHVNTIFNKFKKYHNKNYTKGEHEIRKNILRENWRKVKAHNEQTHSYKLTLNQFADRTPEELRHLKSGRIPHKHDPGTHLFPHDETEIQKLVKDIPDEWDWRLRGKVSKVKNQGSCGSCWAYAAAVAIESAYSIQQNGTNFDLSEQFIVDCAWPYESSGCDGGYATGGYQLAMKHGIPSEESYGFYLDADGKCNVDRSNDSYKIRGYTAVTKLRVDALKVAVYKYGPVSASVYVSDEFSFYSNGIFNELYGPEKGTNHEVAVVGYGVRDLVPYWIVKNSWGQNWGEDGYILIASLNNAANILLYSAYYPLV